MLLILLKSPVNGDQEPKSAPPPIESAMLKTKSFALSTIFFIMPFNIDGTIPEENSPGMTFPITFIRRSFTFSGLVTQSQISVDQSFTLLNAAELTSFVPCHNFEAPDFVDDHRPDSVSPTPDLYCGMTPRLAKSRVL